ncbi:MAG: 16S rRNA (guanine(966)-N(2))-methyltransferase RsmD, partial [Haloechinothrix sp.]
MTRIVAGVAGGRRLRVPAGGTRPTSERVREALFSALDAGHELAGARVLDLYAGSGALGLEALSRGASDAYFIEADRRAAEVLRGNVSSLALGGTVRQGKVEVVVAEGAATRFDVVLADPPYALSNIELSGVLRSLAEGGWIAPGGLIVVERALRDGDIGWPERYRPLRIRRYGDTA